MNNDEYKISEESARNEVKRILEYYDTDLEYSGFENENDLVMKRVILGFRRGDIEIIEDDNKGFCIKQNLRKGEPLIYREMKGKHKISQSETTLNDQPFLMMYTVLGKLSGCGKDVIAELSGRDLKNAEALAGLFFTCSAQ